MQYVETFFKNDDTFEKTGPRTPLEKNEGNFRIADKPNSRNAAPTFVIPRPTISNTEGSAISYDNNNGILRIMMPNGDIRDDLKLPSEAHLTHIATKIKQILDTPQ